MKMFFYILLERWITHKIIEYIVVGLILEP